MSVQSEINRIDSAKDDIREAIIAKGVDVPASTKIDGLAAYVAQIQTGSPLHAWTMKHTAGSSFAIPYDTNGEAIGTDNPDSYGIYFIAGSYEVKQRAYIGGWDTITQYHPTVCYVSVTGDGIYIYKIAEEGTTNIDDIGAYDYNGVLQWRLGNNSSTARNKGLFIVKMADL